jgi:hypothetical protein
MRLFKIVPIVGFCAVSFLSVSAIADNHIQQIVNLESKMCVDATSEEGFAQQSLCNPALKGQQWEYQDDKFVNQNWPTQCLDIYVVKDKTLPDLNTVQTSKCEGWKEAQKWTIDNKSRLIKNHYTGQCLAAPGPKEFGPLKAVPCQNRGSFQMWRVK